MTNERIILLGAGGFGREVLSWACDATENGLLNRVEYYLDDNKNLSLNDLYDCQYLGSIANYKVQPSDRFLLGIASPDIKRKIYKQFEKYIDQFITLIHPTAVTASTGIPYCSPSFTILARFAMVSFSYS